MKSETLPEAAARMKAMSDAEKEGFAAASEGQLVVAPSEAAVRRAEQLDSGDEDRLQAMEDMKFTGGEFIDDDADNATDMNEIAGATSQNPPGVRSDAGSKGGRGRKAGGAKKSRG